MTPTEPNRDRERRRHVRTWVVSLVLGLAIWATAIVALVVAVRVVGE